MRQSKYIHKSHNVSVLLYHYVCSAKYRRVIFSDSAGHTLTQTCIEISKRYQIHFLEIGTDADHVPFLVQSAGTYRPTKIVAARKSIIARKVFSRHPEVKAELWGREFWSDGYFVNTVSKFGDESTISKSVREQEKQKEYTELYKTSQLALF